MAMELFVLSERALESIDDWQRSIDNNGFPLQLSNNKPFEQLRGFLPAALRGEETGFECDHWRVSDLTDGFGVEISSRWTHALAFRMTGRISEVAAAYMAASAYARATNGAVLDSEEGQFISAERAAEIAREIELVGPRVMEAAERAVKAAMKK